MALAVLIAAVLFIVIAYQGTYHEFFALLKNDFSGPNNFIIWVAAILIIGAIGFIPKLKPISNAFLILIFVVIFLVNRGFFGQLNAALKGTAFSSPSVPSSSGSGLSPSGSFIPGVNPLPQGWPEGVDPFKLGVPQ